MTLQTHWKKIKNPKYMGVHDLYNDKGEKTTIETKITRIYTEIIMGQKGEESCIIASLENTKPIILGTQNCKRLTDLTGSPIPEKWVNTYISLRITRERWFAKWDEYLRIFKPDSQPKIAAATAPEKPNLNPESPNWADAVNYYATAPDKDKAKAAIYGKYTITPGDWATLTGKGGENV
jgi:hypothetical protein